MIYAGALVSGGDVLSEGAAMAMARDALAAARADFRALMREDAAGRVPRVVGRGGRPERNAGMVQDFAGGDFGGRDFGGRAVAARRGALLDGRQEGGAQRQPAAALAGQVPGRTRVAGQVMRVPVVPARVPGCGPATGNGFGAAVARGAAGGGANRAVGGSAGGLLGRGRGGMSWPGAQYMFIVGLMGLALAAAALELMSR